MRTEVPTGLVKQVGNI